MHVPLLEFESPFDFELSENLSWWDPESQCTIVISSPSADRELWLEYLRGAELSYRRHGVERALDVAAIRAGADTVLFWAMLDDAVKNVPPAVGQLHELEEILIVDRSTREIHRHQRQPPVLCDTGFEQLDGYPADRVQNDHASDVGRPRPKPSMSESSIGPARSSRRRAACVHR